jgi:20S proteasome subunit alpha 7
MSWISGKDGPTQGRHEEVPAKLREEAEKAAEKAAKKALEGEDEDDDATNEDKMEE